jgi:hypothetical protein
VSAWLPPAFFLVAFMCFMGALITGSRLGPERIGTPPTQRQFWTGWIPGEFTPRGQQLRRRMTGFVLLGVILVAAAILI